MRPREEIEKTTPKRMEMDPHYGVLVLLEVLLDIRDLLWAQDGRPAVTHPKSPPAPEVKP